MKSIQSLFYHDVVLNEDRTWELLPVDRRNVPIVETKALAALERLYRANVDTVRKHVRNTICVLEVFEE